MTPAETISTHDLRSPFRAEAVLWSASLLVTVSVMTSALYAASLITPEREETGGGAPAIMIDFAPMPMAPEMSEEILAVAGAEPIEASDDEAFDGQDDPEPEPVEENETAPLETPLPEPSETEETEPETTAPAEEVEEPAAPTDGPPDPAEIETPEAEAELDMPRPVDIPPEIARSRAATPATSHAPAPRPEPQAAAPATPAPAQPSATQTAPQPASPPVPPAPPASQVSPERWQGQLFAHLDRFKRYPADASRRREQGVVYVQFSIDAGGNILSSRIVRSSGYASLDESVAQMMRSASPVPAPPANLGNPVTLTAPIEFSVR